MDLQNNNVVISVVIPAYNRANIIKECLDSVVAQTYKNIEVIVVDDCSKDNTADIVDAYDDDRVRKCIRLDKNSGACKARNVGADAAIGKYIAFQDSDDIWFPEKLEKQLKYLEEGNFDFVFCGMYRGNSVKKTYCPYWGFDEKKDAQNQILFANRCSTQCMLMTKKIFDMVKFDESLKRFQDWDFSIRVAEIGKIGYLAEALVESEIQSDSISSIISRYESLKIIYNKFENIIRNDDILMATFYRKFGDEVWKVDKKKAAKYYAQSLKWQFDFKILVKFILSKVKNDNNNIKQSSKDKIKIGILTYHRSKNYGAFLQAYGLCKRLNQESDIEAEIIDFYMNKETKHYMITRNPIRFIKGYKKWMFKKKIICKFKQIYGMAPLSTNTCESDKIEDFANFVRGKYDVIIVGSDEVWKTDSFREFPNPYWLIGELDCKKVSYAASSRNDFLKLDDETKLKIKEYLSVFDYITVRDNKTVDLIHKIFEEKINVNIMPDPSFVYNYPVSAKRGRDILFKRAGFNKEDKVIVVMTENSLLQKMISKELGDKYRIVSVFEYSEYIKNLPDLSPFDWLDVISCADLVLASYFHAICFSIILGKKFLAFGTEKKKDKLISVLSQLNLENRYINIDSVLCNEGELSEIVNNVALCQYDRSKEVSELREHFKQFLEKIREKDER